MVKNGQKTPKKLQKSFFEHDLQPGPKLGRFIIILLNVHYLSEKKLFFPGGEKKFWAFQNIDFAEKWIFMKINMISLNKQVFGISETYQTLIR